MLFSTAHQTGYIEMNVTLILKGNKENQIKNFKISKNRNYKYFRKALSGFRKLKGTVFVKYFTGDMFKIAGIVEGYIIIIQEEMINA